MYIRYCRCPPAQQIVAIQLNQAVRYSVSEEHDSCFLLHCRYENEASIRQTVEADVAGLKAVLADLTFAKGDLTARLTGLSEDIATLKKHHAEVQYST